MQENKFIFTGEIVRSHDNSRGGSVIVRGYSKSDYNYENNVVELPVLLAGELWDDLTSIPYKYTVVKFEGHMVMNTHISKSGNVKQYIKFICDAFTRV